ncbi:MAG: tripartite tricarboxylate transporter permease [Rhizobiaceae bacterium]|nr:tripartite tricarboxylate transporter permease [Rhizobiaceae bacterium]
METLVAAVGLVFTSEVLLTVIASSFLGIVMGAIPGLTALMALALILPFTFYMSPVAAAAAMVSASAMAMTAGDIPGALMRVPGTPASAAYTMDSYTLGLEGKAHRALGVGIIVSAFGGILGAIYLMLIAPTLAEVAFYFSSDEYFWLTLLGLSCTTLIGGGSTIRSAIAVFIGLGLGTVGLSVEGGVPRFTGGYTELLGGIPLIPALIGLFAVPELIKMARPVADNAARIVKVKGRLFLDSIADVWRYKRGILASSNLGAVIGVVPGAGSDVAAWITYGLSRRFTKLKPETTEWRLQGVANASAANNAALGGAWVPALVFGIPGDTLTALVISVLYVQGIRPGPSIFTESGPEVFAIFIIFILANILLLPMAWMCVRAMNLLMQVPRYAIVPMILTVCVVGAYAADNDSFGIWVMVVFGILGWILESNKIPLGPVVLGFILGRPLEQYFVASLQKYGGDPFGLLTRPTATALAVCVGILWSFQIFSLVRNLIGTRRSIKPQGE